MALKPILKTKVDELFLRWLSDAEVQSSLRDNLLQICRGEPVTEPVPQSNSQRSWSGRSSTGSLLAPGSPKLPSPRSPRRPLHTKKSNNDANKPSVPVNSKEKELGNHVKPGAPTQTATETIEGIKPSPATRDAKSAKGEPRPLQSGQDPSNKKLPGKDTNQTSPKDAKPSDISNVKKVPLPQDDVRENKENSLKTKSGISSKRSPLVNAALSSNIPQFYFPRGRPKPETQSNIEAVLERLSVQFKSFEGGKAYKQQMAEITKLCGLPMFWKILLFRAAGGGTEGFVTFQSISILIKKLFQNCHDDASKFLRLAAKSGTSFLDFDDFEPLIQDVVETHPGLTFLQDAPEFHSRYVTTVISRIMFCVNRTWTGRITLSELSKSNFIQTLNRLETEEDINQVKDFFSYEHFYVIYCKFWELDKDHDLYIDKNDLSRHNDHALNSRLVDRIFSGAVTRGQDFHEGRMSYKEFVWFLLAEEDKKHMTSIEYWFRCMDLDGDGVISMYEMEFFHEEQMNKMETLGIERLPFEDTVCQMMDMVSPARQGKITLSDLKACKMTSIFFDTFFNLDKFLDHEQRDPFANARDPNAEPEEVSDWNKYAEEEYDILVADEGNADMEEGNYEDDFEPEDEDEILREEMLRLADAPQRGNTTTNSSNSEDIYDFSGSTNLGY